MFQSIIMFISKNFKHENWIDFIINQKEVELIEIHKFVSKISDNNN